MSKLRALSSEHDLCLHWGFASWVVHARSYLRNNMRNYKSMPHTWCYVRTDWTKILGPMALCLAALYISCWLTPLIKCGEGGAVGFKIISMTFTVLCFLAKHLIFIVEKSAPLGVRVGVKSLHIFLTTLCFIVKQAAGRPIPTVVYSSSHMEYIWSGWDFFFNFVRSEYVFLVRALLVATFLFVCLAMMLGQPSKEDQSFVENCRIHCAKCISQWADDRMGKLHFEKHIKTYSKCAVQFGKRMQVRRIYHRGECVLLMSQNGKMKPI